MTVDLPNLDIEHLHGPEEIPYGEDELVVVCLVRDGRPWIKAFVEHYFSLGVKHIAFLDNNSRDGTVSAAGRYDNVSVLQTKLPFEDGQLLMRQYLIARFGKGRWSLCVDIDELFDYPYSDVIGLSSLLRYLDSKSYTAVAAYMLDMIPDKPLAGGTGGAEELSKEQHAFYDLSGLRRRSIEEHPHFSGNRLESNEIEWIRGGIRDTVFGVAPTLTKFPLVFSNGRVKPMEGSSHGVANARIADFSCVLFHYKFLSQFREQVARAVQEENYWLNSTQYKQYLAVLDKNTSLTLKQETAMKMTSVNDLLENGFLAASEDYVSWVNSEDQRNLLQSAPSESEGLVEALLESRRQERVKTLSLGRVERHLFRSKSQEEPKPHRIQKLNNELRDRDERIQRLERQLRDRDRRLQESREKQRRLLRQRQRLRGRIDRLEQQLQGMEASLRWRLVKVLRGSKAKLLGMRKQYAFWRAMRRFSALPRDAVVPPTVLSDLIYGWGNPWSAKHEYIRAFVGHAWAAEAPILECGSGLSTILLGIVAERTGNKVWSLEHDPYWAKRVRSTLQRYGIQSVVLCETDLRDYGPYLWYDPPKDSMPEDFSVVVCDGPPGSTRGGRYGMLPVMKQYLKPGCVVLLDDAERKSEKEIIAHWAKELDAGYEILGSEKPFAVFFVPSNEDRTEEYAY